MPRKYIKVPPSALELQQQEKNGIPAGMTCAVRMQRGVPRVFGYANKVRVKAKMPIGDCPRYATVWKDGEPRCSAHGRPRRE